LVFQILLRLSDRFRQDADQPQVTSHAFPYMPEERSTFRAKVAMRRKSEDKRLPVFVPVNAGKAGCSDSYPQLQRRRGSSRQAGLEAAVSRRPEGDNSSRALRKVNLLQRG